MRRPEEITVAAVVAFIGSGIFIFAGIYVGASIGTFLRSAGQKHAGVIVGGSGDPSFQILKSILVLTIIVPIVLGLAGMITAVGLLRMRRWARLSVIAWCVISSLVCLIGLIHPGHGSHVRMYPPAVLVWTLLLFPINAWWLLLFLRPAIREQFALGSAGGRSEELTKM